MQNSRLNGAFRWLVILVISALFVPSQTDAAPPQILVEPSNKTCHAGDSVVFRVYQTGGATRWFVNRMEVTAGVAGDSLTLRNLQLTDDKSTVQCLIGNSDGVRPCATVVLNVLRPTREMLTFSGNLSELSGVQVAQGTTSTINMRLDIFKSAEGGVPAYTEVFAAEEGRGIQVTDGNFILRAGMGRVVSGALTELVQEASPLFAQFSVGSDESREELLPRVPLTAMPYAISSGNDLLKGQGSPETLRLEAPIGTRYTDMSNGKIWVRGVRNWVVLP